MNRTRTSRLVGVLITALMLIAGHSTAASWAGTQTAVVAAAPVVQDGEAIQYAVHSSSYGFSFFPGIEDATFRVVPGSAVNGTAVIEMVSGEPRVRFTPNGRFIGKASYRYEATDTSGTVVALGEYRVKVIPLHTHLYGMKITPASHVMTQASGTRIDVGINHGLDAVGINGSVLTLTVDGVQVDAVRSDTAGRLVLTVPQGTMAPGQHYLLVRYAATSWAQGASQGAYVTVAG